MREENRRGFWIPVILCFFLAGLSSCRVSAADADTEGSGGGCRKAVLQNSEKASDLTVLKEVVPVKGLDRTYRLLVVSDLHIIVPDDPQVDKDKQEEVEQRRKLFQTDGGQKSADLWKELPAWLDSQRADMILFAGDMIDFDTKSSAEALKTGLDSLATPWMYVRGDHDYAAWYSKNFETQKEAIKLQTHTAPRRKVMKKTIGKLTVIGWDNNTSQITEKGLRDLKKDLKKAKQNRNPVLFLCHVPLLSGTEDSAAGQNLPDVNQLEDKCRESWGGRLLLWGYEKDCVYRPNDLTGEALKALLKSQSPVSLVVSGHLHFFYTGHVTDRVTQVIAPPAFEGKIMELILEPAG